MAGEQKVKKTRQEIRTDALKKRITTHISDYYPHIENSGKYKYRELYYVTDEPPYEMWRFDYAENEEADPDSVWLLCDSEEIVSYDDAEDAFIEILNEKRSRESHHLLKYFTSPLAISAILALILCCGILGIVIWRKDVPPQLWTIFTAVIAFYFGRENSGRGKAVDPK